MFKLKESNLPDDPKYSANLKTLGFFINEAGQFRQIDYPDKDFVYHFSNNDRHNDVRREAMQTCQREEVLKRLSALGLKKLYVPQLTYTKPGEAHIPILAPPTHVLKDRKRVVVLINDGLQDLGILAYRQLQRELGVNGGSVVNFAKELIKRSTDAKDESIFKDGACVKDENTEAPGLIVMNCGQLIYSYKFKRPMTLRSWHALPRKSMYHDSIQIVEENHVEGNRDSTEHIKFVIENVIKNTDFVADDAEIYVIAIENGAENLLEILGSDYPKFGSRITAMAFINPFVNSSQITNTQLKPFLHRRARQWNVFSGSNNPRECIQAPLKYSTDVEVIDSSSNDDTDNYPICPTFANGDNPMGAGECVFTDPKVQHCILDFFDDVAKNPTGYQNPVFKTPIAVSEMATDWDNEGIKEGQELQDAAYQPLQPLEMSPEQAELQAKKTELKGMKAALLHIPKNSPELQAGKEGLEKRIVQAEKEVEELMKTTLAAGGLKAGEAQDLRSNWTHVGEGPKIPFAGVMVDSEMVKGAGLQEIADEELEKLGLKDE